MLNEFFVDKAAGGEPTAVNKSLRFNSADSTSLSLASYSGSGTFSCWVKRAVTGSAQTIITNVAFAADDTLNGSTGEFRDTSAWMHIVVSSNGTYVNGTSVGSGSAVTPSAIGSGCNLYLAEVHFVDGQALTASDFGEFDSNNVWQPKAYAGSYGTEGFYLDFSDNSSTSTLGNDTSGNGNDWTANNFSVASGSGNDSLTDHPTDGGTDTGAGGEVSGNYATLNPVDGYPTGLSNGNLDAASANAYPTIIPESGQWYYEVDGTGYTWDGTRANWTPRAGSHNFGQRAFSSTATSGYLALCTANLGTPAIADGSTVVDATIYTGNGSTQSITGLGFSPDVVWIKSRSAATPHRLYDTNRGVHRGLQVDSGSLSENNSSTSLTAFNADGWTLGDDSNVNNNTATYVGWAWDCGSSSSSNTDGSITTELRANTTSGVSVFTYTGNGLNNQTLGHGLGAAPEIAIIKNRAGGSNAWVVYTNVIDGSNDFLTLNGTGAKGNTTNFAPTSTTITIPSSSIVNGTFMFGWAFTPIPGFSKFGVYTGNGSTSGPFVYTGFSPKIVIVKRTDASSIWRMIDSERDPYSQAQNSLSSSETDAEITTQLQADWLANGFVIKSNTTHTNNSGATYFYMAFAEHPFKNARAQ